MKKNLIAVCSLISAFIISVCLLTLSLSSKNPEEGIHILLYIVWWACFLPISAVVHIRYAAGSGKRRCLMFGLYLLTIAASYFLSTSIAWGFHIEILYINGVLPIAIVWSAIWLLLGLIRIKRPEKTSDAVLSLVLPFIVSTCLLILSYIFGDLRIIFNTFGWWVIFLPLSALIHSISVAGDGKRRYLISGMFVAMIAVSYLFSVLVASFVYGNFMYYIRELPFAIVWSVVWSLIGLIRPKKPEREEIAEAEIV